MHPDVAAAAQRIMAIRALLADPATGAVPMQQIEDELCRGYAHALEGDAWSMATEERLHELINDPTMPERGSEVRAFAVEHAKFQRSLNELRHELAALRSDYDRLRAPWHAKAS